MSTLLRRALAPIGLSLLITLLAAAAASASAVTFTVNSTDDAPLFPSTSTTCQTATQGQCTLRAAVQAADNAGAASTIKLPAGDYKLTIPSTAANDPSNGDLDINNDSNNAAVTLVGAGSGSTTIDANHVDRAFTVEYAGSLSLSGVTIENGVPSTNSTSSNEGGAIFSVGDVSITGDTVFKDNVASSQGGAIYGGGELTIAGGTVFQDNTAPAGGGAIFQTETGPLSVTGATFTGNSTESSSSSGSPGGALYVVGSATISGSTFSSNSAELGAGIFDAASGGAVTVDTSTFTGNTGNDGAAVASEAGGSLTVTYSTFTSNQASLLGGAVLVGFIGSNSGAAMLFGDQFTSNIGGIGGSLAASTTGPGVSLMADEFDRNLSTGASAGWPGQTGGGAVALGAGALTSTGSSFVENSAPAGGAFATAGGTLSLTNTTISGNSASALGGGIDLAAPGITGSTSPVSLTMQNDTVALNSASNGGGGIYNTSNVATGSPGVINTIVGGNSGGDCGDASGGSQFAAAVDAGHNLDSDSSCFGGLGAPADKTGVDPELAPPTHNGGPVLTDAERVGSPAIDAGTSGSCPATDARGVPRPQGAACDIGAYEFQAAGVNLKGSGPASASAGVPFNDAFTVAGAGPGPATGTTVTVRLPVGATLFGATSSQGSCTASASPVTVTCALGTVASRSSATVTLTLAGAHSGQLAATATATDEEGSRTQATASTQVRTPVAPAGATAPKATTGRATKVSRTRATLTGGVQTGGQPTQWFFQYGTGGRFGSTTPVRQITAPGSIKAVVGLSPGTTYQYRLVAINDSGASFGRTRKLHTPGAKYNGRLVLDGTRLRVRGGRVSARFTCASSRACVGKFSITTNALTAKTHRTAIVVCTRGSTPAFRIPAHETRTVSSAVPAGCLSLLRAAAGHRLAAKLTSKPRTPQAPVIQSIRLTLG